MIYVEILLSETQQIPFPLWQDCQNTLEGSFIEFGLGLPLQRCHRVYEFEPAASLIIHLNIQQRHSYDMIAEEFFCFQLLTVGPGLLPYFTIIFL